MRPLNLSCAHVRQDQAPPPRHSDVLGMLAYIFFFLFQATNKSKSARRKDFHITIEFVNTEGMIVSKNPLLMTQLRSNGGLNS